MLLDLNKEIMNELGVTVVGDIIAILKHAKVVHRQVGFVPLRARGHMLGEEEHWQSTQRLSKHGQAGAPYSSVALAFCLISLSLSFSSCSCRSMTFVAGYALA